MIDLGLALFTAIPAAVAGYAGFFAWRGKRRNAEDACAHCGGPQYAAPGYETPALVQGRLVCAPCAARSRQRVRTALFGAGAMGSAAVLVAGAAAVIGASGVAFPLVVAAEYAGLFGGAVAWMKRRNRAALAATPSLRPADIPRRLA